MPQIYDMGPPALLPLRRKACWGFFRPEKSESANFGTTGCSTQKWTVKKAVNISRQMLIVTVLLGMTLYYYMCSSWQDCCRRGENRSWPSVSVASVDSECWCLSNAIFLRFHNAVNSGRTCIYFGKLFKNDVLRPL
jgi:hypothetical protein